MNLYLFLLAIFIANAIADNLFFSIILNRKEKATMPKWFMLKSAVFAGFSAVVSILIFGNVFLK